MDNCINQFIMEGYCLDAIILTSYTAFDYGRIIKYLRASGVCAKFDFNRMWLFQCNPCFKKSDNSAKGKEWFYQRIFKPGCKYNGEPIDCKKCLENMTKAEPKPPKKVFHPKLWLLRFVRSDENKGEKASVIWRMVISSKNFSAGAESLTDCYYSVEAGGPVVNTGDSANIDDDVRPVISGEVNTAIEAFLADLMTEMPEEEKKAFCKMKNEIAALPWEKELHVFYTNGNQYDEGRLPWKLTEEPEEISVLTPFLDETMADTILTCKRAAIYTKQGTVSGNVLGRYSGQIFAVPYFEADGKRSDWHAKIFQWRTKDGWYVMLGSVNATKRAFGVNTELSVWLKTENKPFGDWSGEAPIGADSDRPDESGDNRPITSEDIFDPKNGEQIHSTTITGTQMETIRRQMRHDMLKAAKETAMESLKRKLGVSADERYDSIENLLYCRDVNEEQFKDLLSSFGSEEICPEIRADSEWEEYVRGCKDLIGAVSRYTSD